MTEIDRKDRAILSALQRDGRMSNRKLAEEVGLSESAALARVRRLERAGVIRGYHADIAAEILGGHVTVYAEVTLAHHRAGDFALFDRLVGAIPEIVEAVQVSGPADYLIKAVVPDMDAWGRISDAILDKGVSIDNVRSTVVMKTAKRFAGLPLAARKEGG